MKLPKTIGGLMLVVAIVAIALGTAINLGELFPAALVFALLITFGVVCTRVSKRLSAQG